MTADQAGQVVVTLVDQHGTSTQPKVADIADPVLKQELIDLLTAPKIHLHGPIVRHITT